MPRSSSIPMMASDVWSEIGMGCGIGVTRWMVLASLTPAREQVVVEHEGRLVWRRWALEESSEHGDDDVASAEGREKVTHPRRAGGGVELVAALLEARRRIRSQVRSEGHHQDVSFVLAPVRDHALALGIDGHDRFLAEHDARLVDIPVRQADLLHRPATEHDVELGEAEDEGVALDR